MTTTHLIPEDLLDLHEVHEWRNAAGALFTAHPEEWEEAMAALRMFRFGATDVLAPGKNKSELAKSFDAALFGFGWRETRFRTAIMVDAHEKCRDSRKAVWVRRVRKWREA
jgi:CRISPR-associated protein Csd2